MRDVTELFARLNRSRFRRSIALDPADRTYLAQHSLQTLLQHAHDLISQRLAPANPSRDGRQTPWRGHPVFTAQHATATCCRRCLAKWHGVPQGVAMSFEEVVYVVDVIHYWWRHPAQLEWQMAASQDVLKSDTSSLSDTPRASERPLVKQQDLFAWPPDEVTDDH